MKTRTEKKNRGTEREREFTLTCMEVHACLYERERGREFTRAYTYTCARVCVCLPTRNVYGDHELAVKSVFPFPASDALYSGREDSRTQLHTHPGQLRVCSRDFGGWLVAYRPSNMRVYLRDGSAQTSLRAATLRWKLQIQLSLSPSHSILTPGRPVPVLTL